MPYTPPPRSAKCKNCGQDIVLSGTYYTHAATGRIYCYPSSSGNQAEPK